MNIEYERRDVTRWSRGFWYEVESGERVGSDVIEALLNERWQTMNADVRYPYNLRNRVTLDMPEPRARELRKRKTVDGYYRLADYTGAISALLVLAIVALIMLHFLGAHP